MRFEIKYLEEKYTEIDSQKKNSQRIAKIMEKIVISCANKR